MLNMLRSLSNAKKSPQAENKSSENIKFDDKESLLVFSSVALEICKAAETNSFFVNVDVSNSETYAAKSTGARFKHHSAEPGTIVTNNVEITYKEADYFLEVSRDGKCKYELFVNGNYYPLSIAMLNPAVKKFHDDHIEPLANPIAISDQWEKVDNINIEEPISPRPGK